MHEAAATAAATGSPEEGRLLLNLQQLKSELGYRPIFRFFLLLLVLIFGGVDDDGDDDDDDDDDGGGGDEVFHLTD